MTSKWDKWATGWGLNLSKTPQGRLLPRRKEVVGTRGPGDRLGGFASTAAGRNANTAGRGLGKVLPKDPLEAEKYDPPWN